MDFGDKLKELRTAQGLSQEQLAEKIGVSRQAITKWETKKGLPDIENMVILSELFKMTLDELVMQESQRRTAEKNCFESETVYDIDGDKHFDIHMGSARSISVTSGSDEKIHILLRSETLENLGSLYKIKLDEKRGNIDVDCIAQKGVTRYETEASVDMLLTLPADYTSHVEIAASTSDLRIENIHLDCLEYDGDAKYVYIRDAIGSIELTSKTNYEITLEGVCTKVDVNQFSASSVVHISDPDKYKAVSNGRKCSIVFRKDGEICGEPLCTNGERIISVSGIRSELVIDCRSASNVYSLLLKAC